VVDIDDYACPCYGKALHRIGEDTSERLNIVPCWWFAAPNMAAGLVRTWWCRPLRRPGLLRADCQPRPR
jgi:hypothetical protein